MRDSLKYFYVYVYLVFLFISIVGYCSNTDSYPQVYPAPAPPPTIIELRTSDMPVPAVEPKETVSESSPISAAKQKQEATGPVQESVAQNGGTSSTAFVSYDQNPSILEIEASTDPNDEDYYIEHYPINVNVDVRSKSSYPLSNVIIKDETDPDLIIKNKSRYCIIDPFEESIGNNRFPNGNYPEQIGGFLLTNKFSINE